MALLVVCGSAGTAEAQGAGQGIAIVGEKIAVDDTVIPSYSVGADEPSGACRAGADLFVDRARKELFFCPNGEYAALAGRDESERGEALLLPQGDMRAVSRQSLREAGEIRLAQVRLVATLELNELTFVTTTGARGARISVGLYALNGQLVAKVGPIGAGGDPVVTALVSPAVRLDAGVYWLAWTGDQRRAELVTEAPPATAFAQLRNAGLAVVRGVAVNRAQNGRLPDRIESVRPDDVVLAPIVKLAH